jgi:16S rRNA (adenine1518-N6/adenine1519-N6)-dimethyltransferase
MKTPKLKSGHRARSRFGQNFLIDHKVIADIVNAIKPLDSEFIVEIGPGLGALTEPLLRDSKNLTTIEIDRDLAAILNRRYGEINGFRLICQDVLKTDFTKLSTGTMRIVGNLPYNIATPVLFHLLQFAPRLADMHFMLQKEVVDRIVASPGNKNYGRLSVTMQYRCLVEPLFTVPPSAFKPSPKITSAFVRLVPYAIPPTPALDPEYFNRLVKLCFQQRRKTLHNCLKPLTTNRDILPALNANLSARPETLSVEDFVSLSNQLCALQ